ncbi:hypothetical protein KIW84_073391 [Lathyrus oleraceus]|uniref:Uncharacterized protein n=1 Tax=Pisum sativum TaxID=3888 RepID=A0A9D4VPV4_PEA|nr:hypothetical protein KIW84_073391 [Pisum sativum]
MILVFSNNSNNQSVSIQQQQHQQQLQQRTNYNNNNNQQSFERKKVSFDPIPISYVELYPSSVLKNLIQPRNHPQIPEPLPWWLKPVLRCVFHHGAPGHDIENCYPLNYEVQNLVKSGMVSFEDRAPNVKANMLHAHGNAFVNMVDGCTSEYKVYDVRHIRQSLVEIHKDICLLSDSGPVPYTSDKVVHYQYNATMIENGQEIPIPVANSMVNIDDISKFDHIIANITSCNNLSFCDEELLEEGRNHNLALHISMNCKEDAMFNMLVVTGSSLNVLPKSTMSRLSYQGATMRYSGVIVKTFNGSRKTVIGEVDLPMKIGPSDF